MLLIGPPRYQITTIVDNNSLENQIAIEKYRVVALCLVFHLVTAMLGPAGPMSLRCERFVSSWSDGLRFQRLKTGTDGHFKKNRK